METYFHIGHARKTCVTAYLNLREESQKCGKLRDFWEKTVVVCIDIVLSAQCCCAKDIDTCLWIFFPMNSTRWHE